MELGRQQNFIELSHLAIRDSAFTAIESFHRPNSFCGASTGAVLRSLNVLRLFPLRIALYYSVCVYVYCWRGISSHNK